MVIRSWISHPRTKEQMTDKTISRKLSALTNYFYLASVQKRSFLLNP